MADGDPTGERGFTVVDRRAGREESPEAEAAPAPAAPAAEADAGAAPGPPASGGEPAALPAIDFSTFVLSMGTSALYHLGLVPDPETGEPLPEKNLPLARQTIDTLEMLREKTRGNLEEEERKLIESLLYELRMRFVEVSG